MSKTPGVCKLVRNCLVSQAVLGTLVAPSPLGRGWKGLSLCLKPEREGRKAVFSLQAANSSPLLSKMYLSEVQSKLEEIEKLYFLGTLAVFIFLASGVCRVIFQMIFQFFLGEAWLWDPGCHAPGCHILPGPAAGGSG